MFLMYSLKNPSFPESVYQTETGVMSLDFHPSHPNLLCCGFYDGSVAVYNVGDESKRAKYLSTARNGKHTDPVWEVSVLMVGEREPRSPSIGIRFDGKRMIWTTI